jgi:LCP family protein required for cell wall assembly
VTQQRRLQHVDPLRDPAHLDARHRDVRGWVLLAATLILPGSVQTYFRARRARIPLVITLVTWLVILVALVLILIRRQTAFTLVTNPFILTGALALLVVAGVSWLLCLLDTVRRVRLHTLSPRARTRFLAVAVVAMLVVTGGTAYGSIMVNSQRALMTDLFAAGLGERPVDGRYNILLLGSDAGKGRQGIRPDSITLVSVDAKTGGAVMIGLPRNMQNVPFDEDSPLREIYPNGFDCGDECLLNAVYQQGEEHADAYPDDVVPGVEAMKEAVGGVTGLEVQYHAMIDLQGFEDLIDAMGGITVVSGKRVPISSKVDPSTGQHGPVLGWIEPGEQHLDGYHALWFARSREFASDYERMVRQRCVQDAMVRQLDPSTLLLRFQDIATAAPEVVTTDIPQIQVDRFVDLALKTRSAGTSSLNLTPPEVDPTHPDFAQVHELVASAIAESEESAEAASGPAVPGTGALGEVSVWAAPQAGASPADVSAAGATGEADEGAAEDEDASAICSVP